MSEEEHQEILKQFEDLETRLREELSRFYQQMETRFANFMQGQQREIKVQEQLLHQMTNQYERHLSDVNAITARSMESTHDYLLHLFDLAVRLQDAPRRSGENLMELVQVASQYLKKVIEKGMQDGDPRYIFTDGPLRRPVQPQQEPQHTQGPQYMHQEPPPPAQDNHRHRGLEWEEQLEDAILNAREPREFLKHTGMAEQSFGVFHQVEPPAIVDTILQQSKSPILHSKVGISWLTYCADELLKMHEEMEKQPRPSNMSEAEAMRVAEELRRHIQNDMEAQAAKDKADQQVSEEEFGATVEPEEPAESKPEAEVDLESEIEVEIESDEPKEPTED